MGDPDPADEAPGHSRRGSSSGIIAGSLVGQVLNALSGIVVARVLGPSGRGEVALVGVYDEVSTTALEVGVANASGFFAKEGRYSEGTLLLAALRFALFMLPVSTGAGAIVALVALRDLSPSARWVGFAVIALTPLANTYLLAARNLLIARGDLKTLARFPLVQMSARMGFIGLLAALGVLMPWSAALIVSASTALGNAWCRRVLRTRRASPSAPLPELLAFGVKTVPGALSNLANNRLDQLLIAPFLGTAALGRYAVAVGVTWIPITIANSYAHAQFSRIRLEQPDAMAVAGSVLRSTWLVLGAASVATAGISVGAIQFLYGDEYHSAIGPALLLMPGVLFYGVQIVAAFVGNAIERPGHGSIGQIVGVVVTVAGLVIALPRYGIAGAAVVSSLAYATRLGVTLGLLRRSGVEGMMPRPTDLREAVDAARTAVDKARTR